jgi:uncharacterized membrane protein YdjX (TVP38/TMEM64 family)
MKKIFSTLFFCTVLVLAMFLFFSEMEQWIGLYLNAQRSKWNYAIFSSLFLTADIILPIPSSLIMILNGKILGAILGSLISFVSGLTSSMIGFYMGCRSMPFVNRFFNVRERNAGNMFFEKYGNLAIVMSKSLPVISESLSVVAGTTSVSFRSFFLYSAAGHLTVSLAYGVIGSYAFSLDSKLVSGLVIFAVPVIGWLFHKFISRGKPA